MSSIESIRFYAKQVSTFEEGFLYAKNHENYHLLSLNSRQVFLSQLMQALITWRSGENPRSFIEQGVERGLESVKALLELDPEANLKNAFPIEKLQILAFLIDREIEVEKDCRSIEPPDRKLDCILAAILAGESISSFNDAVAVELIRLSKVKRSALAAKTYQLYFDILKYEGVGEVDTADNLYRQRAVDAFYVNGYESEGGGLDNGLVVDYRLGAILKYLDYSGSSVHLWRW
jgi:hypothetical protein